MVVATMTFCLPDALAIDRRFYIDKSGNETSGPKVPVLPASAKPPEHGNVVIQPSFTDGRARYRSGDLWGYIDESGKVVIPAQFDIAYYFSDGIAICRLPGKDFMIIDRDGRVKANLSPLCQPIGELNYHDGLCRCSWGERRGPRQGAFLDHNGNLAFPPSDRDIGDFSNGIARFSILDAGKYKTGYVNKKGETVIAPEYEEGSVFCEGLAAVKKDGHWSFIDTSGKTVIKLPADCTAASCFSEGLAAIAFGGTVLKGHYPPLVGAKLGFIDKGGKVVIPPTFYAQGIIAFSRFSEGLAAVPVEKNGYLVYGFIDKSGKFAIPAEYKKAYPFEDGRAKVVSGVFGFDPEEWQKRMYPMGCSRGEMFDDLIHRQHFIGMPHSQVLALFGKPQKEESGSITYTLIRKGVDWYEGVEIEFNDDKVSQYRFIRSMHGPAAWESQDPPPSEYPREYIFN